jgi:hypothetical protein
MPLRAGARVSTEGERTMTRLMLAVLLTAFSIASAAAQGPVTCESKAVGKDGKELAGAARTSFLTKCKRDACEPKAIGSDGKALKGAAKKSFMQKCEKEQA